MSKAEQAVRGFGRRFSVWGRTVVAGKHWIELEAVLPHEEGQKSEVFKSVRAFAVTRVSVSSFLKMRVLPWVEV